MQRQMRARVQAGLSPRRSTRSAAGSDSQVVVERVLPTNSRAARVLACDHHIRTFVPFVFWISSGWAKIHTKVKVTLLNNCLVSSTSDSPRDTPGCAPTRSRWPSYRSYQRCSSIFSPVCLAPVCLCTRIRSPGSSTDTERRRPTRSPAEPSPRSARARRTSRRPPPPPPREPSVAVRPSPFPRSPRAPSRLTRRTARHPPRRARRGTPSGHPVGERRSTAAPR